MGVGSVRGCPLIHKVVSRIYALLLHQMTPLILLSQTTLIWNWLFLLYDFGCIKTWEKTF